MGIMENAMMQDICDLCEGLKTFLKDLWKKIKRFFGFDDDDDKEGGGTNSGQSINLLERIKSKVKSYFCKIAMEKMKKYVAEQVNGYISDPDQIDACEVGKKVTMELAKGTISPFGAEAVGSLATGSAQSIKNFLKARQEHTVEKGMEVGLFGDDEE